MVGKFESPEVSHESNSFFEATMLLIPDTDFTIQSLASPRGKWKEGTVEEGNLKMRVKGSLILAPPRPAIARRKLFVDW